MEKGAGVGQGQLIFGHHSTASSFRAWTSLTGVLRRRIQQARNAARGRSWGCERSSCIGGFVFDFDFGFGSGFDLDKASFL